jgi:hypothetical protein
MANTYTQLYFHGVFAIRSRQNLIFDSHAEEIRKYRCGIVTNLGSKPIAVNTMPVLRTSNIHWYFLCYKHTAPTALSDAGQIIGSSVQCKMRMIIGRCPGLYNQAISGLHYKVTIAYVK